MASVFKRNGTGPYLVHYFDHTGKRRERSTRTTDKRVAERLADKWQADAMLRREGVIDADLDEYAKEARRPIAEHVGDYQEYLGGRRSQTHVAQTIKRVERVLEKGKIGNWHDVKPDAVERGLVKIVEDDGIGTKTRNYYLTAFKSFANWMVKQKRASHNPIEAVERLEVEPSEHRRAMEPDEVFRLIAAAHHGKPMERRDRAGSIRWRMTGPERTLLYRLAVETGLRRGAIDHLTVADFDTGEEPTVTVRRRAKTKNRKPLILPLRDATAKLLKEHLRGKDRGAKAFDMPARWETADMLRADLAAARAAWIKEASTPKEAAKRAESDFLAEADAEGRRVDFHAFRTTCATWLEQAGVPASTIKRITGHASEKVLQQNYQRSNAAKVRLAVEVLPSLTVRSTAPGRDNGQQDPQQYSQQVEHDRARSRANGCEASERKSRPGEDRKSLSDAKKDKAPRPDAGPCESEGDGTRTRNLRIDSEASGRFANNLPAGACGGASRRWCCRRSALRAGADVHRCGAMPTHRAVAAPWQGDPPGDHGGGDERSQREAS